MENIFDSRPATCESGIARTKARNHSLTMPVQGAEMQNTSHAVMAQRHEAADSADDFPTPPWATRALIEHVIGVEAVRGLTCLEPACGRGYMARPLCVYLFRRS